MKLDVIGGSVIKLGIRKVKPGEEGRLREWMSRLNSRRAEVLETFRQEGITHEQAFLLDVGGESILVYAMESADHAKASAAYAQSTLAIDLEHRQVMSQVLGEAVRREMLFECQA
jgi:hypothetical protein